MLIKNVRRRTVWMDIFECKLLVVQDYAHNQTQTTKKFNKHTGLWSAQEYSNDRFSGC